MSDDQEIQGSNLQKTPMETDRSQHLSLKDRALRAGAIGLATISPMLPEQHQVTEPLPTATANSELNLRAYPSTNAPREGGLSANDQVNVEASITLSNGNTWLRVSTGEGKSWVFKDLLTVSETDVEIPDVTELANMNILDNMGNSTNQTLGEIDSINLAKVKDKFDELTQLGLPAETFTSENLQVLSFGNNSVVFEQKNNVSNPDGRVNEAGSIITMMFDENGEIGNNWGFWGVGQVADISNAHGASVNSSQARFRPTGEEEILALADSNGGHAIFDWELATRNGLDPEFPIEQAVSSAMVVFPTTFPNGSTLTIDGDSMTFVSEGNGKSISYTINRLQEVKTATPAPVEVAMAPAELNLQEIDSSIIFQTKIEAEALPGYNTPPVYIAVSSQIAAQETAFRNGIQINKEIPIFIGTEVWRDQERTEKVPGFTIDGVPTPLTIEQSYAISFAQARWFLSQQAGQPNEGKNISFEDFLANSSNIQFTTDIAGPNNESMQATFQADAPTILIFKGMAERSSLPSTEVVIDVHSGKVIKRQGPNGEYILELYLDPIEEYTHDTAPWTINFLINEALLSSRSTRNSGVLPDVIYSMPANNYNPNLQLLPDTFYSDLTRPQDWSFAEDQPLVTSS